MRGAAGPLARRRRQMNKKNDSHSVNFHDPGTFGIEHAIGVGFGAGLMAAIFLALLPGSGRVRFGDSECAWLDPYRIPSPFQIGWTRYIIVCLLFTACYCTAVGLLSWGVIRLIPWSWAKTSAKW